MNSSKNQRLILEPYEGSGKIETEVKKGFATIKQKHTLVGLRLLAHAVFNNEDHDILEGATVFFKEEVLYSAEWAKKKYVCDSIDGEFIIADLRDVIMIYEEDIEGR